jgi:2-haloacid dehalogenase
MKAYDNLDTFPDVPPALEALATDSAISAYVFSNGTQSMVSSSVHSSESLRTYASVFADLVTIEGANAYKPSPKVYAHLASKVGQKDMSRIWLVSGNPFDVVGARNAGMQAAWVDRPGGHHGNGGWSDRLGELACGGPTLAVKGVDEAVEQIKEWVKKNEQY